LIASEFATNSVLFSVSRHGGAFSLRAEVHPDCLRIEVEDGGGPWRDGLRGAGRPRGVRCRDGDRRGGNWGIDEDDCGRVAWARSALARGRCAGFLLPADHLRWSAYWDKKYDLWHVAEDNPTPTLYVESSGADTVLAYITAHA
jgi:hypothetical protein